MSLYKNSTLAQIIELNDKLRDIQLEGDGLQLPRIAVVGPQSAGKSTLLESIVGHEFIPRGNGTVTRRPLELRLKHLNDPDAKAYAFFKENSSEKIDNFNQVRVEIENQTKRVIDAKIPFSKDPINLTICSPNCPDLTLIDLPGIIRNSEDENAEEVEILTKEITRSYINDGLTIILAVVNGNTELALSEAINIAREVDKQKKRTVCVITRTDKMDINSDIVRILKNEKKDNDKTGFIFEHGYFAVVGRDTNNEMTVEKGLEREEEFFKQEKKRFQTVADRVGTANLSRKLSSMLCEAILDNLPKIHGEIQEKIKKLEEEIENYGESFPEDDVNKQKNYCYAEIQKLAKMLSNIKDGTQVDGTNSRGFYGESFFEISAQAFCREKSKQFGEELDKIQPVSFVMDLVKSKKVFLKGFPEATILKNKIASQLEKLKKLIAHFVQTIKTHNITLVGRAVSALKISSLVKGVFRKYAEEFLNEVVKKTEVLIDSLIECEKVVIWTSDERCMLFNEEKRSQARQEDEEDFLKSSSFEKQDQTKQHRGFLETTKLKSNFENIEQIIKEFQKCVQEIPDLKQEYEAICKSEADISKLVTADEVNFLCFQLARYLDILDKNLSDTITKVVAANLLRHYYDDFHFALFDKIERIIVDVIKKMENDPQRQKKLVTLNELNHLKEAEELLNQFDMESRLNKGM